MKFLHYALEQPIIEKEDLLKFVQQYLEGKLEANMKRETPPDNDAGTPVKTVVYDTFGDLVLQAPNDVVLLFYKGTLQMTYFTKIPDDSNYRKLIPAYERLGELLSKEGIQFAKINLEKNDVPRHGMQSVITGVPTIKMFFSTKKKMPEKFDEAMITPNVLVDWINTHATYIYWMTLNSCWQCICTANKNSMSSSKCNLRSTHFDAQKIKQQFSTEEHKAIDLHDEL